MTTTTPPVPVAPAVEPKLSRAQRRAAEAKTKLSSPWASGIAIVIAILWTIPTFGLLLTSFRPEQEIRTTGWWTYFTNPGLTLDNYDEVLFGSTTQFATFFVNTIVITIPAVIIPITIALLAA